MRRVNNGVCIYFRDLEDCLCNNAPDNPGECVYEGGIEPQNPSLRCPHYKPYDSDQDSQNTTSRSAYKAVTAEELAEYINKLTGNEALSFASSFDRDGDGEIIGSSAEDWYGVKILNLFDGQCLLVGGYGGGAWHSYDVSDVTICPVESKSMITAALNSLFHDLMISNVCVEEKNHELMDDEPGPRCKCGNNRFHASQLCYHDVIVNAYNIFEDDEGVKESERPYGAYTCTKCGAEYEELDELEDGNE